YTPHRGAANRFAGLARADISPTGSRNPGEGYFEVQMPNGNTAYTRDGSLQVSDQGVLVTGQGYAIQPPIRVPKEATSITISETGVVTANGLTTAAGGTQELGRIELARFPNSSGLES